MEETCGTVSTIHFRHLGPDNARLGNRNCCAVVDVCTNNDVEIQHNECMQLFHLHWEDTDAGNEMSSITVSEAGADHKSTIITPDHVNKLLKDQAALHDFTRQMLTTHQVQLIRVEYAPLVLTFQHNNGSDTNMLKRERFKVFIIVKEFVLKATGLQDLKGLQIGIHKSKNVSQETDLWWCHRACKDVSAQRRLNSVRSSSEDDDASVAIPFRIERRFIKIEDELFKQRQFMESHFNDQEQQYEIISASLVKISQAFWNGRGQSPQPLTSEENYEHTSVRNLIDFDLEPPGHSSSLHSTQETIAYRPVIEILSAEEQEEDFDDGDDGKEEKGEESRQGEDSVAKGKYEVSIGSKDETEERKTQSDEDPSDDVPVTEKMVLPNESDTADSNHMEDEHGERVYKPNSPNKKIPVLQQKRNFPDHKNVTKAYIPNNDSRSRNTENKEFRENVGGIRKQTNENSYSHKRSYQAAGNRSQAVYGHATIAQCKSLHKEQQAGHQPRRGVAAATPDEGAKYLEDMLYSYTYASSRQNAYSDMQSDAVNIQPTYAPASETSDKPKKNKIQGDETKEQDLRLMIECAIGNSPYRSRIWESAQEALQEEEYPAPRHDLAPDTIICLDTSGSMRGEAFQEMKKITLDFINGIEDVAEQYDVEENIALVTFGGRAKVIHHLSNDYGSLRDALEKITPGGPSPIHEGLIVSMAALAKGGIYRVTNRMELRPRMIFLTDGKPTVEMSESASDSQWISAQDQNRIINAFQEIRSRQPNDDLPDEIVLVPIGQSCIWECIETLASVCNGKVKDAMSFAQLSKFHYLHKVAAQAIEHINRNRNEPDIFVAGLSSLFSNLGPDIDRASAVEIYNIIAVNLTSVWHDIHEEPGLPPLGTRVVRGPDWKWGNQDTEGPGTIYNHAKQNIVLVIWDNGHSNYYRCGHGGKYDVTVVEDQPRVLSGNLVAVGVQVERGPGWHLVYGNQDGGHGSYGTIIRQTPGKVKVIDTTYNPERDRANSFGFDGRMGKSTTTDMESACSTYLFVTQLRVSWKQLPRQILTWVLLKILQVSSQAKMETDPIYGRGRTSRMAGNHILKPMMLK